MLIPLLRSQFPPISMFKSQIPTGNSVRNMENTWKPQVSKWNQHGNQSPKVEMGWKFITESGNDIVSSNEIWKCCAIPILTSHFHMLSTLSLELPCYYHFDAPIFTTIPYWNCKLSILKWKLKTNFHFLLWRKVEIVHS
jgi:hypothetical protein